LKKIGCTMMLAFLLISLVPVNTLAKTQLTLWDWHEPRATFTSKFIERYQELNPDIEIGISLVSDYWSKALVSIVSDVAPDMMQMHNASIDQFAEVLTPYPEDLFPLGELMEEYMAFDMLGMYRGQVYYLPLGLMTAAIYFNKAMLNEVGMSEPPLNWADFTSTARKLSKRGSDGELERSGFAFFWDNQWLFTDIVYQCGGTLFKEDGANIDSPESRRALELLTDLMNADIDFPEANLEKGSAAMLYRWTWYEGFVRRAEGLDYGAQMIPTPTGDSVPARGRNNVEVGISVPSTVSPGRQRMAFEFIKWLFDQDDFVAELNAQLGTIPARSKLWDRPEFTGNETFTMLMKQAPYTVFPGPVPNWYWNDILGELAVCSREGGNPITILPDLQRKADAFYAEEPPGQLVESYYKPPAE